MIKNFNCIFILLFLKNLLNSILTIIVDKNNKKDSGIFKYFITLLTLLLILFLTIIIIMVIILLKDKKIIGITSDYIISKALPILSLLILLILNITTLILGIISDKENDENKNIQIWLYINSSLSFIGMLYYIYQTCGKNSLKL